jgi:molybdopterin converting factor small subunit
LFNKNEAMELTVLSFGIAKDIVGGPSCTATLSEGATVGDLKHTLLRQYPDFQELASLAIAVNNAYAKDNQVLTPNDEVVIIPPVSGG